MAILGTLSRRLSSVMVPTTTIVFPSWVAAACGFETRDARRAREIGGRLVRDMKRRRRITVLKGEDVRPGKRTCQFRCIYMVSANR